VQQAIIDYHLKTYPLSDYTQLISTTRISMHAQPKGSTFCPQKKKKHTLKWALKAGTGSPGQEV